MGTKSFFTKQKSQSKLRNEERLSINDVTASVESVEYIKQHKRDKTTFLPELDFSDPANFVKYGSAKDYYVDLVDRITASFPYDGSLTERLKFKNELVAIQRYEFDNNYPRSVGYADFNDSNYASSVNRFTAGGVTFGLGDSSTNHYIITDNYSKNLVYNTASNQVGSIELDFSEGTTVEFWMNKRSFPNPTKTQNEVIFSISNETSDFFHVATDVTGSGSILACFALGKTATEFIYEFDSGLTTIADSSWHHYALSFSTNSAGYVGELYVDGHFKQKQYYTKASPFLVLTGTLDATVAASSISDYLGDGKLSASLDEVRLWKTRRNAKQVGENYFFDVGGGGNTDNAKTSKYNPLDLSLYYKFNEGNTGDSTLDNIVLDYSGRMTDGVWIGYNTSTHISRATGSAIISSGTTTEVGSPIIYSSHPDVISYKSEKQVSGSSYDAENNNSLYDMLPQWISDEDSENGLVIRKLIQIMASYLDTLHAQITAISMLQDGLYVSGSSAKPNPFSKRNLLSYGFEIPDVFIDSEIIEEIYFKDEKRLYEDKLYNLKNLIFQNIFNNLNFINKSKGTEKSFRNLFRSLGVDNELVRLNLYADNQEYEFRENYEASQAKRNIIDLSGYKDTQSREAVIYQFADALTASARTGDYGYIPSASNVYLPLTVETQIYFPKYVNFPNGHLDQRLDRASLFGIHSASSATTQTTIPDNDLFIKVYADTNTNNKTQFVLTSSIASVEILSSSFYEQVYDNNAWTFAVRIKPREYPFSSVVTASNTFDFEFYGVNYSSGIKLHEFSESKEVTIQNIGSVGSFITGSNKRLYVGADRTNITGTINYKTNTKILSSRVWFDYLENIELQNHARDINIFGRTNPYENTFIYEGAVSGNYIPRIETLGLHWNFENITGSNSSGKFLIQDITSGSSTAVLDKYAAGDYYNLSGRNYGGQGSGFSNDSTNVVDFLFVDSAQQQLPENLYSSDLIEIRSEDDVLFTRESRPSKYYFAVETSLYDTISHNILGFFASIEEFNNLIGDPVNLYRPNYKNLEKLRTLFFENIQNDPDLEKYINMYKWLDGALDGILANIIPASATVSEKVRSVVESHLLERSKYRHKYLHVKELTKEDRIIGQTPRRTGDGSGGAGKGGNRELPPTTDTGITIEDAPRVVGTIVGAPLRSPANLSYIVPEDIRKGKSFTDRSGLRPTRPAGPDPRPVTFNEIRSPHPSDLSDTKQNLSPLWWRLRAERNPSSIMGTNNAGVDKTRTVIQINKTPIISGSSQSPLVLNIDAQRSVGTNVGFAGENRKNYFPNSFKHGTGNEFNQDGIVVELRTTDADKSAINLKGQPYYEYSGAIDETYNENKLMPISVLDQKNSINLADKKYIPFDLLSASSPISPYQDSMFAGGCGLSASVVGAHRDYVVEGTTLQGPFTDTHVGGWMYRHDQLLKNPANLTERKEGYHVNLFAGGIHLNNPRIIRPAASAFTNTRPLGNYLRNVATKRPVNIQNISGSTSMYQIGNYLHEYEIIQTTGRKENNRYYVKSEGATGTIDSSTEKIVYDSDGTYAYKDFEVLDRTNTGSNNFIIVNRFSAPGGPEVSAFSFLDVEAAEYSVYNNLNYRNQTVRFANNKLLTRHTLSGGYDSVLLQPTASYYKPQRNGVYKISASLTSPEPVFDNSYVNYGIPRTDVQYSWVVSSWIARKTGYPNEATIHSTSGLLTASTDNPVFLQNDSDFDYNISSSDYSPIYGYQYSTNIRYISASHIQYGVGSNIPVAAAFNGTNYIIVGDIDLGQNLFTTASIAPGNYYSLPDFSVETAPYLLNAVLLSNNGPYQHPTFRQIRTGDHRVARQFRKQNLYKAQLDVFSRDRNRREKAGKSYALTQSAVTSKFKPVMQSVDQATGTIQYSFGNVYDYFAKTYNSIKNEIEDYNLELGAPANNIYESDFYKFSKKYNTIVYKETIYPREENEYRELSRNRENYVSFWDSNELDIRTTAEITTSQGTVIDASKWLMDVSTSGSGELETSGELMRFTGSLGVTSSLFNVRQARYSFTLGECRPYNTVQSQAGTGAFYTSYGLYATDTRLLGQDEQLIPEFTISDYVRDIVLTYRGDFSERAAYSFLLTGSKFLPSASFLETYGKTEQVTYLEELKDFYGEPTGIRLKFDVTKKLLPRDGFYPVQRTAQLANQFSSSYSGSTLLSSGVESATPAGTNKTFETTLMPFWAPGVGYNSIKAGFAVEFPYKSDPLRGPSASIYEEFDSRAPFESILSPSEYVNQIHHICNSSSATYAVNEALVQSTGSTNKTDGVYELMAHNFFAETPEFFLDNLTTFKSSPEQAWEFEGPLSSSAGVKKFAMDIVIENPIDFIQYGQPQSYGPFPYNNHAPPGMYFTILGAQPQPACPNMTNIMGLGGGSSRNASTTATLVFDPTELLSTDSRTGQTTFSLKDIVANSTIDSVHSLGECAHMSCTASLNLFKLDEEKRWTINSKWEAPVLNFASTTSTGGGGAIYKTKGMWHQYGDLSTKIAPRSRLHVRLQETSYNNSALTSSLLDAVGFAAEAKAFGGIKNSKLVEEAICAIPFYVDCKTGEEKFFEIPINIFENRYSLIRTNQVTEDSISDMIRNMDKYVVPPHYDFVSTRDKSRRILSVKADYEPNNPPFSMYFFQFSSELNQQDLANVWQGVMPSIATKAEKETVILEHPITDGELLSPSIFRYNGLSSIPNDIRWKLFKVKKRASYDYYKMLERQTGVATYKRSDADRFSYNWPYDYCSLVELGKMEVGFEVQNDSPNRIRDIRGGGYITPEEVIKTSIDLGSPLTVSKEAERDTAPTCTPDDARELQLLVNKSQTQQSALGGPIAGSLTARETSRLQTLLAKCPRPEPATPALPLIDIGLFSDIAIPDPAPRERLCDDETAINFNEPGPCRYDEPEFTSPGEVPEREPERVPEREPEPARFTVSAASAASAAIATAGATTIEETDIGGFDTAGPDPYSVEAGGQAICTDEEQAELQTLITIKADDGDLFPLDLQRRLTELQGKC